MILTLCDSPFHFLLSTFSPIIFFILLIFTFFFHDVGDKYPAHSHQWGPWHPCRVRPSHKLWAQRPAHLRNHWTFLTTILKKKKQNLLENCHKYALELFWNVYTWHELEDLIFYGPWTNLDESLWQTPESTDFLVFLTHVYTNNVVVWVTLQNSADWECFKTLILQEILRIQNLRQVEHIAFSEAIRLFQWVGCARKKLQFRTVPQNQKSFPALILRVDLQDSKSTSGGTLCIFGSHILCPMSWMCKKQTVIEIRWFACSGIIGSNCFLSLEIFLLFQIERGNLWMVKTNLTIKSVQWKTLIWFPQMFNPQWSFIVWVWRQWGCDQDDYERQKSNKETCFQDPQSCSWLDVRSNQSGPQNPNQIHRHQNQLADILTKGNFTRDEWNHLLTLFNISHFSSTACIAAMAKRAQQDSGEGRVTAKSRPMMNLTARTFRSCLLQLPPTRGGPRMDVKILNNLFLTIERGQPVETSRSDNSQDYGLSVFSRVDKWRWRTRSIRATWEKFLGFIAKSWLSSWRTSCRQEYAFCKVRRADSR